MSQTQKELDIPPPDPSFHPRKANIYDELTKQSVSLAPIFPFTHPGSIFSGTTNQRGDQWPAGRFEHKNSVDEIVLCLGSSLGQLRTGQVFVQSGQHDVSGIDTGSPEDYLAFYYLQRQKLEGSQPESVGLCCEKCGHRVYVHEVDWGKDNFATAAGRDRVPTIVCSEQWAVKVNEHPEVRKCGACGHQNSAFPDENDGWGWRRYAINIDIATRAELAMKEIST